MAEGSNQGYVYIASCLLTLQECQLSPVLLLGSVCDLGD